MKKLSLVLVYLAAMFILGALSKLASGAEPQPSQPPSQPSSPSSSPTDLRGMSPDEQGYLGVGLLPATGNSDLGMEIVSIDQNSTAQSIGLYVGDHIIAVDGNYSNNFADTLEELREAYTNGYGDAQLLIRRNYGTHTEVILISTPALRTTADLYSQPTPPPSPPTTSSTISSTTAASMENQNHRVPPPEQSEPLSWIVVAAIFGTFFVGWKMSK